MKRVGKLINQGDLLQLVLLGHKCCRLSRKCRRVAGDIDDALGFQPNDLIGRFGTAAAPGWV